MAEKFTLTPKYLVTMAKMLGSLKAHLAQENARWGVVDAGFGLLAIFKDAEKVESIGKEADKWRHDLGEKYSKTNDNLDHTDHEMLKQTVVRWEERLDTLSPKWVLFSPDTHIDAAKLNKGVEAFLSDAECNTLEPIEKHGLGEAASSLLFNNFTSAEFMALRTAESLLKRWYERKKSIKLGKTTWGEVLEKLSLEFPKKAERPKELLLLDYLRERRNEIAHPDAVSNSIQASTTFFNVISLCQTLQSE